MEFENEVPFCPSISLCAWLEIEKVDKFRQTSKFFVILNLAAYANTRGYIKPRIFDLQNVLASETRSFSLLVPDYHVTHPVRVDENGNFLSRVLSNSNHRRRRDLSNAIREPVFFYLSAFGQYLHLNVTLNSDLLSPNFAVEVRGNQTSKFYNDVAQCHYTGHVLSEKGLGAKVALSNCDGLVRDLSRNELCSLVWALAANKGTQSE